MSPTTAPDDCASSFSPRDDGGNGSKIQTPSAEPLPDFDYTRYRQLVADIFTEWTEWKLTGDQKYLNSVTRKAKEVDKTNLLLKTIPIGFSESAGLGFGTPPSYVIEEFVRWFPRAELYGHIKLPHAAAKFSAASYEHCNNLLLTSQSRKPDLEHPDLDDLIRHAYIPTPNLINGMPVIGPIPISKNISAHFLSWVKGPVLHHQLASTKNEKEVLGLISELQRQQLWAVSQMTGIWQAYPYPSGLSPPANLEEIVKDHYSETAVGSLNQYISFAGLSLSPKRIDLLENIMKKITSKLIINPNPINGNVGRYFDSALRNFVSEVGNVNATAEDVLNRVLKNGAIDYYSLFDATRRIDFGSVGRLWSLYDEDVAHITENCNVSASEEQKTQYHAAVTLTRLALLHYKAFEQRQDTESLKKAIDLAKFIGSVRGGSSSPNEIPEYADYCTTYDPNMEIVPWLRKFRQGVLALVYMSKLYAYEVETKVAAKQEDLNVLCTEVQHYLSRAIDDFPLVYNVALSQETSEIDDIQNLLNEVLHNVKAGKFSKEHMLKIGKEYLDAFR